VGKSYRPWAPLQGFLLPPSPTEWLPQGHLAYFILDVVEQLDLGAIERVIAAKDARGERPYSPRMLMAVLLYGYCVGIFSSRRLARATHEDVAFRVLAGGSHPHFTTINEFRLVHGAALADLFVQSVRLCARAGLVDLGHVSVDGAKILANASKHKAMSYKRMKDEEARLKAEMQALLRRADEVDRAEDETYGAGRDPWCDVPEELRRRDARIERIRAAKAELEREAAAARAQELRANAAEQREKAADPTVDPTERRRAATRAMKSEAQADEIDDDDSDGSATVDLPSHRVPHTPDGRPDPNSQRNFTDPDSRIMLKHGGYVQAYNAQVAVDDKAQVIVAQAVTNQPPDQQHLVPMLKLVGKTVGELPARASADSGYFSTANVEYCEANGIDAYVSVGRVDHRGETRFNGTTTYRSDARDRMHAKLTSRIGHAYYSRRKVIVEPVFGQIQQARGFRRFSLRSVRKTRIEWALVCLTHNLLKLFRFGATHPA